MHPRQGNAPSKTLMPDVTDPPDSKAPDGSAQDTSAGPPAGQSRFGQSRFGWGRLAPVAILAAGLVAFFAFGLDRYVSFEALAENRVALKAWVADYGVLAGVVAATAYAAMVAFSIPGGALATIVVGFLFGLYAGSLIVVVGATVGATAVFLAARTALGDSLRARAGKAIRRMEDGFREDAFNYLLFLRLVPVFPFWLVNLVPAFLGVRLRTYVLATVLGIVPGTVVYVSVGNGLGAVFDSGRTPDLGIIFKWEILLPILGLSLLALLPIVVRKLRRRRG